MEQKIIRDGLRVRVDTTDLENAVETANLFIDKIKEANALAKELASLSDCLDFKISVIEQREDD